MSARRRALRMICAGAGALAVVATVLPPLANAGMHLFSAHMGQHLLLIAVAAPLLAASGVLDGFAANRFLRPLFRPVPAWALFVGVFLTWHWPAAFRWAALSEARDLIEMVSILSTACLFWMVVLARAGTQLGDGARALFVIQASVVTDLPGVIMIFARHSVWSMPMENAVAYGLTPMQDQQLAGLLMWVPANILFFGIATALFARWISDPVPSPGKAGR